MVERSLSMREARGSIPRLSTTIQKICRHFATARKHNIVKNGERKKKEKKNFFIIQSLGKILSTDARRILSSKGSTLSTGCWFWSTKLGFGKNFDEDFNAVDRVTADVLTSTSLVTMTNFWVGQ